MDHLRHPNAPRPWIKWSEEQTLHVAVAYSNPFRFRRRRELMDDFRRHMSGFPNVVLHVGELAYGDRPWEVTGEAAEGLPFVENDLQLRTDAEMFHKENILNAIIKRWPRGKGDLDGWRYGAYVDGDMIFTRWDWALETIHLLQHWDMVQLFSSYVDLSIKHDPFKMARSFAWNFHHQEEFLEMRLARLQAGHPNGGDAADHGYATEREMRDIGRFPFGFDPGAPGGGWAFTRDAFDTIGGLLDVNILGGGDSEMAHGLINQVTTLADRTKMSNQPRAEISGTPTHAHAVLLWQKNAGKLEGNFYYLEQHILHPFHGSKSRRFYSQRWKTLREHEFNPYTDLVADWQGIYRWAGNKPRFRDAVRQYLISRSEDDGNLYGTEKPML